MSAAADRMKRLLREPWLGTMLAVLFMYVVFCGLLPDIFLRPLTLAAIARGMVVVALCAVGMTLVIVQGGIDLSVGSVVALVTVVVAIALRDGASPPVAVLLGILTGGACGALNGALVAGLKITPFIVTLGTMSILRGLAKGLAKDGNVFSNAGDLEKLMRASPDSFIPIPPGFFIAVVVAALGALFLRHAKLGRHIVATGSSPATARLCGISIPRVTFVTYLIAGFLAGLAGIMEHSTLTVGDPTTADALELEVIAAVVIGGGSLFGGQGSVVGSVFGALLMVIIATGAAQMGIANWMQEILTGVIIVLAVTIDRLRHR